MTDKPRCFYDTNQAKKWIWNLNRLTDGGHWVCWDCFNKLWESDKIQKSGNNYVHTE